MNATAPGIQWGSREWFDACLTDCPEPLRPAVMEIASRFGSNDSDPNAIARMLVESTRHSMQGARHKLRDGAIVAPSSTMITLTGVSYMGKSLTDGSVYIYGADDVESSEPLHNQPADSIE